MDELGPFSEDMALPNIRLGGISTLRWRLSETMQDLIRHTAERSLLINGLTRTFVSAQGHSIGIQVDTIPNEMPARANGHVGDDSRQENGTLPEPRNDDG